MSNLQLNSYRSHLGLSLTDESPFEGSIRENLTLGDASISNKNIEEVISKIGLTSYLKETDLGLDTVIYPEGKQIPFTVAKKIILARAILKKPKLLMLEESLEHFQKDELKEIIEYITAPKQPWALVVVSYNNEWVNNCSEIITLNKGEII